MTTHIGKIARLSKRRREEVNRRLENGQTGRDILRWLNGLKDVKAVLRAQFGGRAVNKQNLSAWRRSGYGEWLELERQHRSVRRMAEEAEGLAKSVGKRSLGHGLAIALALEMDGLTKMLKQETDPEKRWERVREMHREVSRLRRDDDRVKRTSLRQEALGKAQGLRLKAEVGDEEEADWDPPSQGYGAGRPSLQGAGVSEGYEDEDENENEDEGRAAHQQGLSLVKAGQGEEESKIQSPKSEVEGKLPRIVERKPAIPGYDFVKIEDNLGFWCQEVPKGWELPADWKSPIDLAKMKNEEEVRNESEVQNPKPEGQSLNGGTGGGTPPEPAGGDACDTILLPSASPYVPDPDPEVEAYNRWWRMNRNMEPFDYEELQRIYAELPQKIAEYKARLQRGEGAGELTAEFAEAAGI